MLDALYALYQIELPLRLVLCTVPVFPLFWVKNTAFVLNKEFALALMCFLFF